MTFRLFLLAAMMVGVAAVLKAMERKVLTDRAGTGGTQYHIELYGVPDWMPPTLARFVGRAFLPGRDVEFEDPELARKVCQSGAANPWVAKVRKVNLVRTGARRGVVQVHVNFRKPIARVRHDERDYFVDAEGMVLPFDQVPKWRAWTGKGHRYYLTAESVPAVFKAEPNRYILVYGVATAPPVVGEKWRADDLAVGLRLVQLLHMRKYADRTTVVDVRNHAKRVSESEPELCIYAQEDRGRATEIRFGRFPFPGGGDWVVSPARKMKYLDEYVADHGGRLAGVNEWLDLRFDELRISLR